MLTLPQRWLLRSMQPPSLTAAALAAAPCLLPPAASLADLLRPDGLIRDLLLLHLVLVADGAAVHP